jgi:hypothetical protein
MATKKLDSRIQNKYDTEQNWTTNNPVLLNGELIIVSKEDGTIGFKVGDGVKKYSELSWATSTKNISTENSEGTSLSLSDYLSRMPQNDFSQMKSFKELSITDLNNVITPGTYVGAYFPDIGYNTPIQNVPSMISGNVPSMISGNVSSSENYFFKLNVYYYKTLLEGSSFYLYIQEYQNLLSTDLGQNPIYKFYRSGYGQDTITWNEWDFTSSENVFTKQNGKYIPLANYLETVLISFQKKIEGTDGQVIVKEGTIPGEVKAIDAPWLPITGGTYENMATPFVLNMTDNNTSDRTYQAVLGFVNDANKYSSFALGTQNSSGLSQVLGQSQIETNKFVKVDLLAQDSGHETVLRVLTTGGTGKIMVSDPIEPFSSNGSVRIQSQSGDYCIQVQNEGISLETNGVVLGINESQLIITDGATNAYNINGNANGLEITGLKEPKEYNQPATKQYVDNLIGSGGSNYSKSKTSSFNAIPILASGNPSGYQYYIDETVSGMTSSINPLVFPNWSTLSDMTTYQDDWNKITAIESKDNVLRFYFADGSTSVNIKYIVYY